jgi:hypothetical protein
MQVKFRFAYIAAIALLFMTVGCASNQQAQQTLAKDTAADDAACQHGDSDACTKYMTDQFIASHCPVVQQPAYALFPALLIFSGQWNNPVDADCAERARNMERTVMDCRHGDETACADIDQARAQAQRPASLW